MQNISHRIDSESDRYSLFLYRIGIRVWVSTQVRLRQCKWALTAIKVLNWLHWYRRNDTYSAWKSTTTGLTLFITRSLKSSSSCILIICSFSLHVVVWKPLLIKWLQGRGWKEKDRLDLSCQNLFNASLFNKDIWSHFVTVGFWKLLIH